MRSKRLSQEDGESYVLVFDVGDEVMNELKAFASQTGIDASDFTAIGAFSSTVIGFLDIEAKDYRRIPIEEQVEVLTLVRHISLDQGEPKCMLMSCSGSRREYARGPLLQRNLPATLGFILKQSPGPFAPGSTPKLASPSWGA